MGALFEIQGTVAEGAERETRAAGEDPAREKGLWNWPGRSRKNSGQERPGLWGRAQSEQGSHTRWGHRKERPPTWSLNVFWELISKLNPANLSSVIKLLIFSPEDERLMGKDQTMQRWRYGASPDGEAVLGIHLSKQRLSLGIVPIIFLPGCEFQCELRYRRYNIRAHELKMVSEV